MKYTSNFVVFIFFSNKVPTIVGESHSREKGCPLGRVVVPAIGDIGQPILNDDGISVVKLWTAWPFDFKDWITGWGMIGRVLSSVKGIPEILMYKIWQLFKICPFFWQMTDYLFLSLFYTKFLLKNSSNF